MASNASARRVVGSGGKTAFGDGNGSDGRGTTGNLPRGAYGDRILASREDWVGCGGGSLGDDRVERDSCAKRGSVVWRAALVRSAGDRRCGQGAANAGRKPSMHRSGGVRRIQNGIRRGGEAVVVRARRR
jgi:hypothetical protein